MALGERMTKIRFYSGVALSCTLIAVYLLFDGHPDYAFSFLVVASVFFFLAG